MRHRFALFFPIDDITSFYRRKTEKERESLNCQLERWDDEVGEIQVGVSSHLLQKS